MNPTEEEFLEAQERLTLALRIARLTADRWGTSPSFRESCGPELKKALRDLLGPRSVPFTVDTEHLKEPKGL